MKPDKHKKEKNAIYKKKHGITDSSKQEHKVNEQFRDTKVKDKTPTACVGPSTSRTLTSSSSDDSANKKLGVSDKAGKETFPSSSEELEMPQTNYGRRKVVSNWERYEVEENTTPTVRGSDFAALLKSSACVFSHSQYRDELGLMKREDSTQDTPTKFLTLDCDDLANSLMCIPLHDRLGIETSVFEPLMIQQCFEVSKESASKYTRASDQMDPSPVVAPDYTSAETSNRNAEEQFTVKSDDLSLKICSKASNECLLNTDNGDHSLINDSPKRVKESISSTELGPECQHKVQTLTDATLTDATLTDATLTDATLTDATLTDATLTDATLTDATLTDATLTETLRQPESELGSETPLSSLSAPTVEDKVVARSKCGTVQSLKELENELDMLLGL